eukprot:259361-Prymnesium_polylepis.2
MRPSPHLTSPAAHLRPQALLRARRPAAGCWSGWCVRSATFWAPPARLTAQLVPRAIEARRLPALHRTPPRQARRRALAMRRASGCGSCACELRVSCVCKF